MVSPIFLLLAKSSLAKTDKNVNSQTYVNPSFSLLVLEILFSKIEFYFDIKTKIDKFTVPLHF